MKRPLRPEEHRVWGMVAATVHPLPGRATPKADAADALPPPKGEGQAAKRPGWGSHAQAPRTGPGPETPTRPGLRPVPPSREGEGKKAIEPRRHHRIAKAREEIGGRLDLHGLSQDRARAALEGFLARAWSDGSRAVLVITGKGVQGDGVLRRHAPEWLAAPHLSHMVAGVSPAHRRHGGDGALYVALKRKPRG